MSLRKKVLFLTHLYLPHPGGVEYHLQQLIKHLPSKEFEIILVAEQDDPLEKLSDTIEGIQIYRIPLPNHQTHKGTIWQWWWQHRSLLFSADIIHIHDVFFWTLPLYPWLKFKHKKIFITFHGYEGADNPNWRQMLWHQLAAKLTPGNICIGGFHQKWYGVKPTITSFGAVNPTLVLKKKNLDSTIKIIFAGRLAEDTGIMIYLQGVKRLNQKFQLELDVYGNGPDFLKAQHYVEQHHLPVKFMGFVAHEVIPWQKYHLAFVSRYLAILEAFQAQLPVVAVYDSQIKYDYLTQTPFVEWIKVVGSGKEVSQAVDEIIGSVSSTDLQLAQQWASQQTWSKLSAQYQHLWRR